MAGHRDRAGCRDQAHPADLRGLPGADRQATGGGGRGRDLRGHRRGGIRRAARRVPDVLARRGVLRPEPDRRPGQPVGSVAGRRDGPAGGHRGPAASVVAGRGVRRRPGGPSRRGLGAPARVPDGRVRLLCRHRPAGLADLLDAPLGLGCPGAGVADHGLGAAPRPGCWRRPPPRRSSPTTWPGDRHGMCRNGARRCVSRRGN